MAVNRARCLCPGWLTGRFGVAFAVTLALLCTSVWASAQAERRVPDKKAGPAGAIVPQGPIDFRCDTLEIVTQPEHRQICRGHVILRRDDLVLCCTALVGKSNADWALEQIVCTGDVRLRRGEQIIWAKSGQYDVASGDIVLMGEPLIERGQSRLAGEQMTVRLGEEHARILRPRGQWALTPQAAVAPADTWPPLGPLPTACPIGPKPAGPA